MQGRYKYWSMHVLQMLTAGSDTFASYSLSLYVTHPKSERKRRAAALCKRMNQMQALHDLATRYDPGTAPSRTEKFEL